MRRWQALLISVWTLTGVGSGASGQSSGVKPPVVVWTSPSSNALGSMPLGSGDLSLNAWVETNGDLLFYLGKSDSWEDNSRLTKLGKVA